MTDSDKSLDILGIKPVADAVSVVTTATTAGIGAFLSRICLPAAEEYGLLLRDKVGAWRAQNAIAIATKAETKLRRLSNPDGRHAHPRLVGAVIENGSWIEDDFLQEMWAGLLASGCTEDGQDQLNVIFSTSLAQLTPAQAKVLQFACEKCQKIRSTSGLAVPKVLIISVAEVLEVAGISDVHSMDLQLDHLRGIGLLDIASGLNPDAEMANLCPTALGLQLFIRSEGFLGSPLEYFGL